jgi:hypothetical protein
MIMMSDIKQGEIWLVNLNPTIGAEIGILEAEAMDDIRDAIVLVIATHSDSRHL